VTLVYAIGHHWHAVQRDFLALGFRAADAFTPRLPASEVISIVYAAPPNSSVHHALSGGWTITDHLLATMSEQQAGLAILPERIARPGVTDTRPTKLPDIRDPNTKKLAFDSMTIPEFEARRRARIKGA
jgi:hypothetical protein